MLLLALTPLMSAQQEPSPQTIPALTLVRTAGLEPAMNWV